MAESCQYAINVQCFRSPSFNEVVELASAFAISLGTVEELNVRVGENGEWEAIVLYYE